MAPTEGELRRVKPAPMKGRILRISGRTSHAIPTPARKQTTPIIRNHIPTNCSALNLSIFQMFQCAISFFSGNPHCLHYHPIPKKIQLNSLGRLKKTPPQCHPPKKWPAFVRVMNHHCPLIIPLVKALFPGGIRTLGCPWIPMISRIFVAMKLSSHVNLEPRPGDGILRWQH